LEKTDDCREDLSEKFNERHGLLKSMAIGSQPGMCSVKCVREQNRKVRTYALRIILIMICRDVCGELREEEGLQKASGGAVRLAFDLFLSIPDVTGTKCRSSEDNIRKSYNTSRAGWSKCIFTTLA
jgi:hypothetical protein